MKNKSNKLFFFTESFPYGKSETFIESEIQILSEYFSEIIIFPKTINNFEIRNLPKNVLIKRHVLFTPYNRISLFKKHPFLVVAIFFKQLLYSKHRYIILKNIRKYFNELLHAINNALNLEKDLHEFNFNEGIFYTFWFEYWTFILSIIKYRKNISNLYSRAHGYDLYNERTKTGFHPFRSFQFSQLTHVFSVSEYGQNYLCNKYPLFSKKIKIGRLGVVNNGDNPSNDSSKGITFVSCSNMIPLKRIHLIIEILMNITKPSKWIHFGDGILQDEIQLLSQKLPDNIDVEFKGRLSNLEIIKFYKKVHVDFFITTSETEGLPFSIIEAISFGIPIIATDVGGIPEIVKENVGYLIDKDFSPIKIAQKLNNGDLDICLTNEYRFAVKKFWIEYFNAEKNYTNFIKNF